MNVVLSSRLVEFFMDLIGYCQVVVEGCFIIWKIKAKDNRDVLVLWGKENTLKVVGSCFIRGNKTSNGILHR